MQLVSLVWSFNAAFAPFNRTKTLLVSRCFWENQLASVTTNSFSMQYRFSYCTCTNHPLMLHRRTAILKQDHPLLTGKYWLETHNFIMVSFQCSVVEINNSLFKVHVITAVELNQRLSQTFGQKLTSCPQIIKDCVFASVYRRDFH